MFRDLHVYCVWFIVAFVPVCFSDKPYNQIFVDLHDETPGQTISNFTVIEYYKYAIDILSINSNVSFFVIQVHSYVENISLSFDDPKQDGRFTMGTNIGLVWSLSTGNQPSRGNTVRFFLRRNSQPVSENITVLLAITTYTKYDPIPGGCNKVYETEIAPYQKVTYNDDLITVMSQPPSKFGVFCNENNIMTEVYYMYLREYNNDTDEYFSGIQNMMTVKNILKYGTKVSSRLGDAKFKQMYNLYRGTGRVFAVVSTLNGRSAAYIPAVSFGCNLGNWTEDCIGPVGVHWKLFCAFLLILGGFICFGGHRFFKTGLFTMGYTFGAIVTLVLVSLDDYFSIEVKAVYSLIIGIIFGCFWVLLWRKFGAPLVSVQLTCALAGTLIASIILYNELGDLIYFTDDLIFWLVFAIIVVITLIPIFFYPTLYHIFALSLLGSYAVVVAMNYYVGGNLPYIFINTYRRIAVKNFRLAVVDPPYELLDFIQTLLWALLFGLGIFIQYKHSKGKAPFPPHRSGVNVRPPINETTPLLYPELPSTSSTPWSEVPSAPERTPLVRTAPPPYESLKE